jgi:nitrite reductase (NADH) large subunit
MKFTASVAALVLAVSVQNALSFTLSSPSARLSSTLLHAAEHEKKKVVVIGNGMVGQRFMENLIQLDKDKICQVSTFCEEPRAAYNRVKLTSFFETKDPSALSMTSEFAQDGTTTWYNENGVELLIGDKAVAVDSNKKVVIGQSGKEIPYDTVVYATGSYPFVPPIPGKQRPGVFVYRTIEDLQNMLTYAQEHNVKSAAVIGGGLLGLEAAKVCETLNPSLLVLSVCAISF